MQRASRHSSRSASLLSRRGRRQLVPWLYKWRISTRIYQRYGELMALERVAFGETTAQERADLLKRLDEIERRIVTAKLPASAAEQLYVLRQHINFVRNRIR